MKNIEELKNLIRENKDNSTSEYICIGRGDSKNPHVTNFDISRENIWAFDTKTGWENRLDGNALGNTYYLKRDYLLQEGIVVDVTSTVTVEISEVPKFVFGKVYVNKMGQCAVCTSSSPNTVLTYFTGPDSGKSTPPPLSMKFQLSPLESLVRVNMID